MGEIHVFGHQRPDTDSICSTIAYTNLKRALGVCDINPYRLDNINKETKYVLDYFDVEEPKLLPDLEIKVSDLNVYNPPIISKNDTVKKVWDLILNSTGSRIVPCVDKQDILEGVVSVGDITKLFMQETQDNITSMHEILFDNFLDNLHTEIKFGEYKYRKIEGRIIIGSFENYDDINDSDIVVTTRIETAVDALDNTNCGCIIVTNGLDISSLNGYRKNCAIVSVQGDVFRVVTNIKQSISISSVMQKEHLAIISHNSYLEDAKMLMKTSAHRNFPVISDKGKFVGIISRRHLIDYQRKLAILIDHNERKQSVEGIADAEILEIIDHHRVADVQTDAPILIRSEPVGCTSTIIFKMYMENGIDIPNKMAGLMLSAILSDTLKFSSPTCTSEDRATAEKLAQICSIDIDEFAKDMFQAGTSIKDVTFDELLNTDTKLFNIADNDIYISQINTLDIDGVDSREDEYMLAMDKFTKNADCALLIMMVTDIINSGSKIIIYGKMRSIAEKAFGIHQDEKSIYLSGVVSRKKQIVPKLMMAARDI